VVTDCVAVMEPPGTRVGDGPTHCPQRM
jgi:hypothetical protein